MNDEAILLLIKTGPLLAILALSAYAIHKLVAGLSDGISDVRHHLIQCEPTPYAERVNRFADVNRVIVTRRITPVARRQRCLRRLA